jgi:hypothetical protein
MTVLSLILVASYSIVHQRRQYSDPAGNGTLEINGNDIHTVPGKPNDVHVASKSIELPEHHITSELLNGPLVGELSFYSKASFNRA